MRRFLAAVDHTQAIKLTANMHLDTFRLFDQARLGWVRRRIGLTNVLDPLLHAVKKLIRQFDHPL